MTAFYLNFRYLNQLASLLALLVGIVGIGYSSIAQIRLILGQITFEQNLPQAMIAFGLFGISLLVFNLLARTTAQFPPAFVWLGIIFSAFMAQGLVTSSFFSQQVLVITSGNFNFSGLNSLMYILLATAAISQIGYPVWSFWLGKLLLSGDNIF